LLQFQFNDGSAQAGIRKKGCGIELVDSVTHQKPPPSRCGRLAASSRQEAVASVCLGFVANGPGTTGAGPPEEQPQLHHSP
jgi:hypothetical protein